MTFNFQATAAVILAASSLAGSARAGEPRPNVVLIITDDQNDYFAGVDGLRVETPAFDRLKAEAINFTHAYCAAPVCGPSRAALFSGVSPHKTGVYFNGADPWFVSTRLRACDPLPQVFRQSGYETWGMGKLFHAKLPDERAKLQWDNTARSGGGFGPFADPEHRFSGKFFSVQEWDGPDEDFPDTRNAEAAVSFLESRSADDPFFLVYGLWRPHNPWTAPRRFFDLYEPEAIRFPPSGYASDDLDDVPPDGRRLADIYRSRWKNFGDGNPEAWRRILHGYLACTSFADWNVGRVLDALDRTGHADDTLVIVTSDNGYHVGEKHHYGKSTLWEKSANVPLLVRLPGKTHAGRVSEAAVSLLDVFPTLISQCGLTTPAQSLDGSDLSELLLDPARPWEKPAITTYGEGHFSMKSGPWRYISYPDGSEELYDHRADPHEFTNVAAEPEHAELLVRFRQAVPSVWAESCGGRAG